MILTTIKQKNILFKARLFLKQSKLFSKEISRLDYFYLCPFGSTKGTAKLFFFFRKILALKIYLIASLKDMYKLSRLSDFKIINKDNKDNYKVAVVNWGSKSSFDKSGNFYDKHFNVRSSKCPKVKWIILYLDKKIPKKIKKNITLIYNKEKKVKFKSLIKILIEILKKKKIKYFNQELSYHTYLANFFSENTKKLISKNIKKLIMPYEGQPFQNSIFTEVHSLMNNIKTVGYIHSFPTGLPTNLIKRFGHPKKLIVCSKSQKYCFEKKLGWNKNEIDYLPSARFLKSNNFDMGNKIFLPIQFFDTNFVLRTLKKLFLMKNINLTNIEIRNHPSCFSSKKHIKLTKKIRDLINSQNSNENKREKISIFIGATGSVIEALEKNIKVYHICENPEVEMYNPYIWKYIKIKKVEENIFKYTYLKKGLLINSASSKEIYKKYFYN